MKKIILWAAVVVVALGAAMGGAVLYVAKSNAVLNPGSLYIPSGTDFTTLVDSLKSGEKIRFVRPFELYARRIGLTERVKPGHYTLREGQRAC